MCQKALDRAPSAQALSFNIALASKTMLAVSLPAAQKSCRLLSASARAICRLGPSLSFRAIQRFPSGPLPPLLTRRRSTRP